MHREQLSSLDLNNFPSTIIQSGIPPSPTTTTHHVLKHISLFTLLMFQNKFYERTPTTPRKMHVLFQ